MRNDEPPPPAEPVITKAKAKILAKAESKGIRGRLRRSDLARKCCLTPSSGLREPYSLPQLCALPVNHGIKDRCRQISNDGQRTILNLQTVAKILNELGHNLGGTFLEDRDLLGLIRVRNELMHQLRAVTEVESQEAVQRVNNLLATLALPEPIPRPSLG